MKKYLLIILLIFGTLTLSSCGSKRKEVVISAASSLQSALQEIEVNYESEHEDVDLKFNFGGSGTLLTQIQGGAPTDIYISASKENYDTLNKEGKIYEGEDLLKNELVLIANKDNPITNIKEVNKIAIGTPGAVPAGDYAKQSLEALDIWDTLEDKFVYAKDVEEVVTYVGTQNAQLGFVYKTDAISSDRIKEVKEVDEKLHDPIVYPIGLLQTTDEAEDFYNYLKSKEALTVFEKYGFLSYDN